MEKWRWANIIRREARLRGLNNRSHSDEGHSQVLCAASASLAENPLECGGTALDGLHGQKANKIFNRDVRRRNFTALPS
jgi:hypothetical protein